MNQSKDSAIKSEQPHQIQQRQESSHIHHDKGFPRKDVSDQQQKGSTIYDKNNIFQQYIAGTSKTNLNVLDSGTQKNTNASFNNNLSNDQVGDNILQPGSSTHNLQKLNIPKPQKSPSSKTPLNQSQPVSLQLHNQQISNSKKTQYDLHTHLSSLGKQAMGGAPLSKVIQIKNQNLNSSIEHRELVLGTQKSGSKDHTSHNISGDLPKVSIVNNGPNLPEYYNKQSAQQSLSFEENKNDGRQQYKIGVNSYTNTEEQAKLHDNSGGTHHLKNNLNQALQMQIQPQKNQRGQRRHFPTKTELNEFELLMKTAQQPAQAESHQHIKMSGVSGNAPSKQLIRRGVAPFPAAASSIFEQQAEPQSASSIQNMSVGNDSNTSKNRIASNPRSAYQQSIFQKHRQHKLQQIESSQQPIGSDTQATPVYQFKNLFVPNAQQSTSGNHLSQYGQTVLNRNSPKANLSREIVSQAVGQAVNTFPSMSNQSFMKFNAEPQQMQVREQPSDQNNTSTFSAQIGGRSYLGSLQQKSSSKMNIQGDNINNTSIGSINADQANGISRKQEENLLSPQPKPSSQMSQYGDNNKNMNSNTAQLIIRKTKAKHPEQVRETRNHYSLTKTDEKQKNPNESKTISTNFRKYKKKQLMEQKRDINVLGQPKTQYDEQFFKNKGNAEGSNAPANQIGTGLYHNKTKRSILTKRGVNNNLQGAQNSITLPSMVKSEKASTHTNNVTVSASINNSFNNPSSLLNEQQAMKQPQTIQVRKNQKHSIFSISNSNYPSNVNENVIQDVNYNVKGGKDTEHIAWEIKFDHADGKGDTSDDQNKLIDTSQDFIYSELQKYRNKSPLIKQKNSQSKNYKFNKAQKTNTQFNNIGVGHDGNETRRNTEKIVKPLKISTKLINAKAIEKALMSVGDASPNKTRGSMNNTNNRSIIQFSGYQHGSGEVSIKTSDNIIAPFRRKVGKQQIQNQQQSNQDSNHIQIPADNKIAQKLEEPVKVKKQLLHNTRIDESIGSKNTTFRKTTKTNKQQIKQYEGELPAELIVTSYKKNFDFENSKPNIKLMNFVGETPQKNADKLNSSKEVEQQDSVFLANDEILIDDTIVEGPNQKVFNYAAQNRQIDNEFFQETNSRDFDNYMTQNSPMIESSDVNPSANPKSEHLNDTTSSHFSRGIFIANNQGTPKKQSDIVIPQIENKIVEGNIEKSIVHKMIPNQSESNAFSSSRNDIRSDIIMQDSSQQQFEKKGTCTKQIRWSGGISASTQFIFNKVVLKNRKIHDNLILLQSVGIINESNSLFQQIVEDIQAQSKNGMTKMDIANCIKASSFGRPSAIEPISIEQSATFLLNIKKSQQIKKTTFKRLVHNSGEQSRGYSQYQRDFQIENFQVDNQFKKSKSLKHIPFWRINPQEYLGRVKSNQQKSQPSKNKRNLLLQSHNLPQIQSLNFQSQGPNENKESSTQMIYNNKPQIAKNDYQKGLLLNLNKAHAFKKSMSSGRANTVRVNINLNQPRRDARQNEILQVQGNHKLHHKGLRLIQSERNFDDFYQQSQGQIKDGGELLNQQNQENISLSNPESLLIMQHTHNQYLFQQKLQQKVEEQNKQDSNQSNNNVVLLTVKPSSLMQNSKESSEILHNSKTSKSGGISGSIQDLKINQMPKNQKFTSYHHTKINPLSSSQSQSQPSQSQRSLPSLQACNSNLNRYTDKQSSSGTKSQEQYNQKYKTSNQVDRGRQIMQGGLFGKDQTASLPSASMQLQQNTYKTPVDQGKIIKWREGDIIGLGSSSVVYSAIRVDSNTILAVKKFKVVSDVTGVDQTKLKIIKNEIQKYKLLNHNNIVKFYGCELLDQFFCIYLEKLDTSLANILSDYGHFEESTIKFYTKQILDGLHFLHDQKIKHLDLKCSNILTNNNESDINIKLCDFGSAREFKKGSNSQSTSFTSLKSQIVGSVQWMAPEVIAEEGSGSKSDIWSLGCTIIEMFIGGNPWGDKIDDQNLFLAQQTILNSDLLPQIPSSRKVSMECQDFISKCLTRNYESRPSASDLLEHPWIINQENNI